MKNCLDCHFLTKEFRGGSGEHFIFPLNDDERKNLNSDPIGFDRGYYAFKCYMGVWDEGISPVSKSEDEIIFSKDRNYSCFFINYQPSMLFPAAVELQKRAQENRNLKRSYRYTIIGLWLAAFGLILNALIDFLK